MIDRITEEKIKDAAKIYDVVSDFITDIKKKGIDYTCHCPFHDDKHLGNFKISPKKNIAKCFSCGWSGDPVKFLMEYGRGMTYKEALLYLAKKYDIVCEDLKGYTYTPPPPRPAPPPLPTLVLPFDLIAPTQKLDTDNLCMYIRGCVKWDEVSRRRIEKVLAEYYIGHSRQGLTIFWYIDKDWKVRSGKMMLYKPDGHRDREAPYNFDWIHATLDRHGYKHLYDSEHQEMRTCIFGEHLLGAYPKDANICLVESEKTAILMAIAYGNHTKQIWMACGGLANINRNKLAPMISANRNIILYPDRDGIEKWQAAARDLKYDKVTVDTTPVTEWWREADGPKADIADVVIRIINNSPRMQSMAEVIDHVPAIKPMAEKLNLEIEKEDGKDRREPGE